MTDLFKALITFISSATWGQIAKLSITAAVLVVLAIVLLIALHRIKDATKGGASFLCAIKAALGIDAVKKCQCLTSHRVFADLDEFALAIDTLDIPDPGRRLVFQDLLRQHGEAIKACLPVLLQSLPPEVRGSMSELDLANKFANTINACERDWRNRWEAQGIPPVVIAAYNKWLDDANIVDTLRQQANLSAYDGFIDNTGRVSTFLNGFDNMANQIRSIGWKAFMSVNGELDGVVYKNITIGPRHIPHD